MERTFKLGACAFTLLTLLSQVLPVSKRADLQSCPPIIASTSNHSTWLPVVHEGQDFHAWQQYTTTGYAEDLEVAWGRQPSSLRCSQFNITSAITDIHTLNTSIAVFDTRVDENCSDEGIYQVFISSNCTFNDNITFNMTFAKNDSCNKDTPPHPETPKSLAIPEPRPGTNDSTTLCVNIRYYGSKDITLYDTQWLLGEQGSCKDNDPNLLCEDDGISEPGSVYTCDRTIFGNCTFLSDFCISNYSRVHSDNYTTIACPTSLGGPIGRISKLELSVIGWPELTEWPGDMNSATMDEIGAKLTYGLTNFSHKFLNITFYNGSSQIANLTHFAAGYTVVITCERCESTTIQLYIPAEGRYKMCYNFTDNVQWAGQSNFPPEYEVPNCTQYTHAIPTTYQLLGETIGGALVLIFIIVLVIGVAINIVHSRHRGREQDENTPLMGSGSINTHDGSQPLNYESITERERILSSQDQKNGCTDDGNSVTTVPDDQLQHIEHDSDQSLSATYNDMADDESYIQPLFSCGKDDGSTHTQETLSSSVEKGDGDGDESDHSGNFPIPESTSGDHSTEQYITKVDEIEHPQQEHNLLTENHNLFLPDLEAQDEVKSSAGIPHPFTAEGPDVTMGVGEVFRLSGNLKPQDCSDDAGTQTLTLPYERRPLPTVADQLNIPFVDPIEILSCDTLGGSYNKHGVQLMIPKGAVLPGEKVSIEFGVTMYGPFKIADRISVKRVSPVVWLCIQQEGFIGFQKDVELTIPHFLHMSTEDASKCLRFLKSDHQLDRLSEDGEVEYQLRRADGEASFDHPTKCTLLTRHFCYFCLVSSIQPDKHTQYCIIGGKPKQILKKQDWEIVFFICYFLEYCTWTVEKQLENDNMSRIHPTTFMFPDGNNVIELSIDTSRAPGWQLALESSNKISAKEVDFQSMRVEDLILRERNKLYPPRFVVAVDGSTSAENSVAIFTFQGAIDPITKQVNLKKGGEPVIQEAKKSCLDRRPTLPEMYCIRDRQGKRIQLINTVASKRVPLGVALHLEYSTIQSIDQSKCHEPEPSCIEILNRWLERGDQTQSPVNWKTLLNALKDCGFIQLAKDMEDAL